MIYYHVLSEVAYFLMIYYNKLFQDLIWSVANVSLTSQVFTSTVFLLLIVRN